MRCPKCGYISFDNVEKCLKCRKNIAETSKLFQGSVFNVATPVFLNLTFDDEELDIPIDGGEAAEAAEAADEDFDFTDPELDVLLVDEEEAESEGDELGELSALGELDGELSEIEAFSEEEEEMTLSMEMEDDADGEPAAPTLDLPDELADISDLSPPKKKAAPGALSMEDDEDLSIDLDLGDFGDSLEEAAKTAATATAVTQAGPKKEKPEEKKLSLDLDDELDFDLDLGGLSIHDKSDN